MENEGQDMLCFIYQYSRYTDERSDREKGSRAQALVKFKKQARLGMELDG